MKRVLNDSLNFEEGLMWLEGEPFTGIGYFLDAKGGLVGEYEYRDGLKWGISRAWYTPGVPFKVTHFFMGTGHGKMQEWHRNGKLKEEIDYELGFTLRKKRWDSEGKIIEEYELKKTDPEYKRLEEFREIYKDDLAREKANGPAS